MRVDSSVMMRAKLFFQFSDQLVHGLALGCEQFQQHQARKNSVAFGNMPRKTNATAFFKAEQHPPF